MRPWSLLSHPESHPSKPCSHTGSFQVFPNAGFPHRGACDALTLCSPASFPSLRPRLCVREAFPDHLSE